jgi:hypothetical protein
VAAHILIRPRVEVKPIEDDALYSHPSFTNKRSHFIVEAIAVHTKVARCIAITDEARENRHYCLRSIAHRYQCMDRRALCSCVNPFDMRLRANGLSKRL